jgi:hypothetical protein
MDQNFLNRGFTDVFDVKIDEEKKLELYSKQKLEQKEYYPGFFITIGKKI